MPARDENFWKARQRAQSAVVSPCHYQDYWQDLYATQMRRRAVEELFPALPRPRDRALRVLDVGCGDGRFGAWVAQRFDVAVSGIDLYGYGAYDRVQRFARVDAENASQVVAKWGYFDVALLITVLPFVASAERVLDELTYVAPYVLVLDNFQDPTPQWQTGLGYKQHIPLSAFYDMAHAAGYFVEQVTAVNVLDRALFVLSPRALYPLAYAATLAGERIARWMLDADWLDFRHVRYSALLLRNEYWLQRRAGNNTME